MTHCRALCHALSPPPPSPHAIPRLTIREHLHRPRLEVNAAQLALAALALAGLAAEYDFELCRHRKLLIQMRKHGTLRGLVVGVPPRSTLEEFFDVGRHARSRLACLRALRAADRLKRLRQHVVQLPCVCVCVCVNTCACARRPCIDAHQDIPRHSCILTKRITHTQLACAHTRLHPSCRHPRRMHTRRARLSHSPKYFCEGTGSKPSGRQSSQSEVGQSTQRKRSPPASCAVRQHVLHLWCGHIQPSHKLDHTS